MSTTPNQQEPKTEDWLDKALERVFWYGNADGTKMLWNGESLDKALEKAKATIRSHTLDKQEVERAIGPDVPHNRMKHRAYDNACTTGCPGYLSAERARIRQALKLTKGQE